MNHSLADRMVDELEAHDPQSAQHARSVAALCGAVVAHAPALIALPVGYAEPEQVRTAALVHDVGKLYVPAWLLQAPRPLKEWERRGYIESHPQSGLTYLYDQAGHDPINDLAIFMTVGHHERWDGSGYPHHAKGLAIHASARLCALADVYDALTASRPYHRGRAMTPALAIDYLLGQAGRMFCPDITPLFCRTVQTLMQVA